MVSRQHKKQAAQTAERPANREAAHEDKIKSAITRLQRTAGNQAVTRLLASSTGQPLDGGTRAEMESRFQENFADVRVHLNGAAEQSAETLGAKAWTAGRDIVFGEGHSPQSAGGKKLLAHELAHVVQQRRGGPQPNTFDTNSVIEHDASAAAGQFEGGTGAVTVSAASGPGVAREEEELPWWKKRLNPLYQRALEVLPSEAAEKLQQANAAAKAFVTGTGVTDENLDKAVQAAEPLLAPVSTALGVENKAPAPPAANDSRTKLPLAGAGGTVLAAGVAPFLNPGGGGFTGPPGIDGSLNIPSNAGGSGFGSQSFANAGQNLATDTVTETAKRTAASVAEDAGPPLLQRLLLFAPKGGVAAAGFAAGFFGPYLIGSAIEHADELQQQPDPDARDQAIAGAPPPVVTSAEDEARSSDALDAGAPEIQQAPSAGPQTPAADPGTGEIAILPSNQNQAPAIDPTPKTSAEAPGQSTEEIEAARRSPGRDRPALRDSTVLEVWRRAAIQGKGRVRNPEGGGYFEPPYYNENGDLVHPDFDLGHREEREWWRLRKLHEAGKLSWDDVIREYNNPDHYQIEDSFFNRGHEGESRDQWVLRDGTVIRYGAGGPYRQRNPRRARPVPNKPARRKR